MKIFFLSCLLMSLSFPFFVSKKEKYADQVLKKASQKIHEQYGLIPIGSGGSMRKNISMLSLSFQLHKKITLAEARKILLDACQVFLTEINKNPSIHPYLSTYPFSENNLEVRIFFYDENTSCPHSPYICTASAIKGTIFYRTKQNPDLLQETFVEAKEHINF
jgi:hypothetical protein